MVSSDPPSRPRRRTVHINRPPTRRSAPAAEPLPLRGSGAHRLATPARPWRSRLGSALRRIARWLLR